MMTKTIVICAMCGKELERQPAQIKKNISGLYFCNNMERFQYQDVHGNYSKGKHVSRGHRRMATS